MYGTHGRSWVIAIAVSFLGVVASGQEPELTAEASNAIQQVRSAGGTAMRIAANSPQYEVSFNLSSTPVKDENLVCLKSIPDLTWLNLANTQISNDGLLHLSKLPLTKLHLEKTKIGDAGLKYLGGLKNLEYLNIYSTDVGDVGLEHLKKLTKLRKLYVWQSHVTDAGIKELQAVLPDLEIVGELSFKSVVLEAEKSEEKDAGNSENESIEKSSDDQKSSGGD